MPKDPFAGTRGPVPDAFYRERNLIARKSTLLWDHTGDEMSRTEVRNALYAWAQFSFLLRKRLLNLGVKRSVRLSGDEDRLDLTQMSVIA